MIAMERATSLTIGALLVLLSSIASAQTTYQDALKIHALRDAFGSDGISAEQIMFAVENDAANAGFNGGSATDGVPVLPPSGGVDVGTTHPASATPKQKFNDATRTRIIVRIKKAL